MSDPFGEPLSDKGKYYGTVAGTLRKLLQDDSGADLVIKIGSETVHAYAAIVSCRCEEIIGFPDEKMKKKKKHEVKLKEGISSAAIMQKVLEYLYTGMVDFSKISDKDILLVYQASKTLKLNRLSYLCEQWLTQHMTVEGVFHLLKAATELREERIKGFCMQFALAHYNDFIANKDGIYILGIDLFQEVVAAFQSAPEPPKPVNPADVPDTLLADLKRLFETLPYSDVTIVVGSDTVKCHRCILSSYSEPMANAIIREPEIELRMSTKAFNSFLRFLYYGDDNIDTLPACELISFCRKFNIVELVDICESKIRKDINPDTVLKILAISYLPGGKQELVDELRSKCVPFILENLDSINFSTIRSFNPLMIVDLLLELQNACKKGQYGLDRIMQVSNSGKSKSGKKSGSETPRKKSSESSETTPVRPTVTRTKSETSTKHRSLRRKSTRQSSDKNLLDSDDGNQPPVKKKKEKKNKKSIS